MLNTATPDSAALLQRSDIPLNEADAWLRQGPRPEGREFEWQDGAPPHVGWWCASRLGVYENWRWWDGTRWSASASESCSPDEAGAIGLRGTEVHKYPIRWCLYWPPGARVQRMDPFNAAMRGRVPAADIWSGEPAGVWRDGPPPHKGWWNASTHPRSDIWRWWDGLCWSMPAHSRQSPETAALCAGLPSGLGMSAVRWTRAWPKNMPPRVDIGALEAKAFLNTLPSAGVLFSCVKKPVLLRFLRAQRSEVVRGAEGTRHASRGDAIVTGQNAERWPEEWNTFVANYAFNLATGVCSKKAPSLQAVQMGEAFELRHPVTGAVLAGRAGDFCVQRSLTEASAVSRGAFLHGFRRA